MAATNTNPILFHNVMRIHDGHLDRFKVAIRDAVAFVAENGTPLMIQVFLDEENMLAHSIQLHRDSESILRYREIADDGITNVMEHVRHEVARF